MGSSASKTRESKGSLQCAFDMAIGLSEDQSVRNFLLKKTQLIRPDFVEITPGSPVTSIEAEKRRNQNVNAYNR